jgi:cystathionine beta-lyase/cystathionine gamma-synthase
LLSLLSTGDHLLIQDCLYGGTHEFVANDLPALGIEFDFIDGNDPDSWERLLRPETRGVYVETLGNPMLGLPNLEAIVAFARDNGLVSMIDNTFASPVNFRPLEKGFDLSLHSATKYLNGHTDIVAGVIVGRADLVERITHKLNHLGGALDPHACFLLHRGLKTLALRVRQQNQSALAIADFLQNQAAIARVIYPGLISHPQHGRARDLLDGFGGMLSFELHEGAKAADRLVANLQLPINAPSLGGVETLITRPALTSHSGMAPEARHRLGITDGLIRLSVGIEAVEDLLADFDRALNS